jgi:hypothetical protein
MTPREQRLFLLLKAAGSRFVPFDVNPCEHEKTRNWDAAHCPSCWHRAVLEEMFRERASRQKIRNHKGGRNDHEQPHAD